MITEIETDLLSEWATWLKKPAPPYIYGRHSLVGMTPMNA